ncbi:MAG: hypothetical protein JSV86_08245 [Gemmatimonadota bacterium]|nr:MAG: hypothetical protein JSV86_08245 [Gemmatimonadota bacterium]
MFTRRSFYVLVGLALLSSVRCSGPCRPMSFMELLGLEIFPDSVAGVWDIDGSPTSAFAPRGYIHAVYDKRDEYCIFKAWVIDKCSAAAAEEWLERLLAGEHTAESVAPFPPAAAENLDYYGAFAMAPASIRNKPLYERTVTDDAGYLSYAVYFTSWRFVVGGESVLCGLRSVRSARAEFLPILENLSLLP